MLYATLATVALGAFTPARPAIRQFSLAKAPQPLRVSPLGMCASEEADSEAGEPAMPVFGALEAQPGRENDFEEARAMSARYIGGSNPRPATAGSENGGGPVIDEERRRRSPGVSSNFWERDQADFKRPFGSVGPVPEETPPPSVSFGATGRETPMPPGLEDIGVITPTRLQRVEAPNDSRQSPLAEVRAREEAARQEAAVARAREEALSRRVADLEARLSAGAGLPGGPGRAGPGPRSAPMSSPAYQTRQSVAPPMNAAQMAAANAKAQWLAMQNEAALDSGWAQANPRTRTPPGGRSPYPNEQFGFDFATGPPMGAAQMAAASAKAAWMAKQGQPSVVGQPPMPMDMRNPMQDMMAQQQVLGGDRMRAANERYGPPSQQFDSRFDERGFGWGDASPMMGEAQMAAANAKAAYRAKKAQPSVVGQTPNPMDMRSPMQDMRSPMQDMRSPMQDMMAQQQQYGPMGFDPRGMGFEPSMGWASPDGTPPMTPAQYAMAETKAAWRVKQNEKDAEMKAWEERRSAPYRFEDRKAAAVPSRLALPPIAATVSGRGAGRRGGAQMSLARYGGGWLTPGEFTAENAKATWRAKQQSVSPWGEQALVVPGAARQMGVGSRYGYGSGRYDDTSYQGAKGSGHSSRVAHPRRPLAADDDERAPPSPRAASGGGTRGRRSCPNCWQRAHKHSPVLLDTPAQADGTTRVR